MNVLKFHDENPMHCILYIPSSFNYYSYYNRYTRARTSFIPFSSLKYSGYIHDINHNNGTTYNEITV